MCTAFHLSFRDSYFGRSLDLDRSYGEELAVLPRRMPLHLRHMGELREHFAMIGVATVVGGVPLFYDAVNEHGLAMAGLNFPDNAYYAKPSCGKDSIASFEIIPFLLSQARSVDEALPLLSRISLVDTPFAPSLPPSPLHFLLADKARAVTVEPTREGLQIYENPVGVLTNNPPFPYQLEHLERYRHLRVDNREVMRSTGLPYSDYSQGMGALGLPGDASSPSRFVRAAFGVRNAEAGETEAQSVLQVMKLLSSVEMIRGLVRTDDGKWDTTVYKVAVNQDRGIYYYTTERSTGIHTVDMHRCDLDASTLFRYPLLTTDAFTAQN